MVGAPSSGAFDVSEIEPDIEVKTLRESIPDAGSGDDAIPLAADDSRYTSSQSPELNTADLGASPADDTTRSHGSSYPLPFVEVTTALRDFEAQVKAFHGRAENYEQIIR